MEQLKGGGVRLTGDRLAEVIEFIAECQKLDSPRLMDICALLRRLKEFKFETATMGLCRLSHEDSAEFVKTIRISSPCLTKDSACDPVGTEHCTADASIHGHTKISDKPGPIPCKPKRFAPVGSIEDGLISCQHSHLGPNYSSCLFLETKGRKLSDEERAVLELAIPPLLHLVEEFASSINSEVAKLTGREKEVLKWIGQGKSNWEISRILGISERTAKYHTSNILEKLGISNRVQAAAFAPMLLNSSESLEAS